MVNLRRCRRRTSWQHQECSHRRIRVQLHATSWPWSLLGCRRRKSLVCRSTLAPYIQCRTVFRQPRARQHSGLYRLEHAVLTGQDTRTISTRRLHSGSRLVSWGEVRAMFSRRSDRMPMKRYGHQSRTSCSAQYGHRFLLLHWERNQDRIRRLDYPD